MKEAQEVVDVVMEEEEKKKQRTLRTSLGLRSQFPCPEIFIARSLAANAASALWLNFSLARFSGQSNAF